MDGCNECVGWGKGFRAGSLLVRVCVCVCLCLCLCDYLWWFGALGSSCRLYASFHGASRGRGVLCYHHLPPLSLALVSLWHHRATPLFLKNNAWATVLSWPFVSNLTQQILQMKWFGPSLTNITVKFPYYFSMFLLSLQVLRQLQQGLAKCYSVAFEKSGAVSDAKITPHTLNFVKKLVSTFGVGLENVSNVSTMFSSAASESLARRAQATAQDPVFQKMKGQFTTGQFQIYSRLYWLRTDGKKNRC